nr:uncharacterized membrane-anchored protein YhcB (DUF1043 family) [Mucilaginibacter sp. X4EP1]
MKTLIYWILVMLGLISTVAIGMIIIGWAFNKPF